MLIIDWWTITYYMLAIGCVKYMLNFPIYIWDLILYIIPYYVSFVVLGCVDPASLGHTQTHEHLSLEYHCAYYPALPEDEPKENVPFSLENLGWIRQYPWVLPKHIWYNDIIMVDTCQNVT